MDSIACAKQKIRAVIAGSQVPEDPRHAQNTLEWVLRIDPGADEALQIAALGHDIDRATEGTKVKRTDFDDYDTFKATHARHGAEVLRQILEECQVEQPIIEEACRLVRCHETGGDPRSDLLKDADSLSFFDVNLPLYSRREGRAETIRRCVWGYQRLSPRNQCFVQNFTYPDENLTNLLKQAMRESKGILSHGLCRADIRNNISTS